MNLRTNTLSLHPLNHVVYGHDVNPELLESIRLLGVLTSIVVSEDHTILSGHQRVAACRALGLVEIPVTVFKGTALEAERLLIHANHQREKTPEQKGREFLELKRIEAALAKERQGARTDIQENLPEGSAGQARDKAAQALGMSGRTAEKLGAVVAAADRDSTARAALDEVNRGKRSVDAAYQDLPKRTKCDMCSDQFDSNSAMKVHRNTTDAEEMKLRRTALEERADIRSLQEPAATVIPVDSTSTALHLHEVTRNKKELWEKHKLYHYTPDRRFNPAARCFEVRQGETVVGMTCALRAPSGNLQNAWRSHKVAVADSRLWREAADLQAELFVALGFRYYCNASDAPKELIAYRDDPESGWKPGSKHGKAPRDGHNSKKFGDKPRRTNADGLIVSHEYLGFSAKLPKINDQSELSQMFYVARRRSDGKLWFDRPRGNWTGFSPTSFQEDDKAGWNDIHMFGEGDTTGEDTNMAQYRRNPKGRKSTVISPRSGWEWVRVETKYKLIAVCVE